MISLSSLRRRKWAFMREKSDIFFPLKGEKSSLTRKSPEKISSEEKKKQALKSKHANKIDHLAAKIWTTHFPNPKNKSKNNDQSFIRPRGLCMKKDINFFAIEKEDEMKWNPRISFFSSEGKIDFFVIGKKNFQFYFTFFCRMRFLQIWLFFFLSANSIEAGENAPTPVCTLAQRWD